MRLPVQEAAAGGSAFICCHSSFPHEGGLTWESCQIPTPGPLPCKGEWHLAVTLVWCSEQMMLSVPGNATLFGCIGGFSCKEKPVVHVHKVGIAECHLSFSCILAD